MPALAAVFVLSSGAARLVPQSDANRDSCLRRFAVVGLPRHRSPAAEADQFHPVICRRGYALSFNTRTRNPDWVAERLTPARLKGRGSRSNRFMPDPMLAAISPVSADFRGSGFDRGHQAPAADAKSDQRAMNESFYMSNMSPQVGAGFNRGQWGALEAQVRRWVMCGHPDVIVFTGPIYGGSARTISSRPILVPDAYYKIVYDTRSRKALGFKLFNRRTPHSDVAAFVVPIAGIEGDTGLDFFPALDPHRQVLLERSTGAVWPRERDCPIKP